LFPISILLQKHPGIRAAFIRYAARRDSTIFIREARITN
jgi:hypothetical protein